MAYHKFTSGEPLDEGAAASNQYFMEEKYVLDEESFQRALALGGLYKRSDKPLHAEWWEVHDKDNHFITQINGQPVLVKIPENEREEGKDPVKLTPVAIENDCTLHKITIDESSLTGPTTTTYTFSVAAHGQGGAISKPSTTAVIVEPTGAGDIIDGAITKTKLMPGCVTTDAIAAGAITADLLACTNLLAKGAYVGALSSLGMVIKDAMFVCTRERLDSQGNLTSDYNFFNADGLNYDFHDIVPYDPAHPARNNYHRYPATNGEVFFGTNPYCEETADRLPVGETLESVGADYKNPDGTWGRDINEYFHYIPSVFEEDKTTHKTVCKKQGMFIFKIANFVITAVSSIVKGVFQVVGKYNNGQMLLTANPENEEREGIAGHSIKINGNMDVSGTLNANALSTEMMVKMANMLMPEGFIYVQFPNTLDPNTLYGELGLVWIEITYDYAGAFFRAAFGNAKAFNGGRQGAQAPSITGTVGAQPTHRNKTPNPSGAFYDDTSGGCEKDSGDKWQGFQLKFDSSRGGASRDIHGNNIYTNGGELRPENFSVRIWKRGHIETVSINDLSIAWANNTPYLDQIDDGNAILPLVILRAAGVDCDTPSMTYVSGYNQNGSTTQSITFNVTSTGNNVRPLDNMGNVTARLTFKAYRPMLASSDVRLLWTAMSAPRVNEVTDGDALALLLTACTTDGTMIAGANIAYVDGFTPNVTTAQDVTFRLTLPVSDRFRMPSEGRDVVFSVTLQEIIDDTTDGGDE